MSHQKFADSLLKISVFHNGSFNWRALPTPLLAFDSRGTKMLSLKMVLVPSERTDVPQLAVHEPLLTVGGRKAVRGRGCA